MEKSFDLKYFIFKIRYLIILIALIVILAIATPVFLSATNIINVLWAIAPVGIIAMGTTFVILVGKIDLSVGKIAALSGIVSVLLLNSGKNIGISILAGIIVAVVASLINGIVIAVLEIQEFIATLSTSYIIMGICRVITKSQTIQVGDPHFTFFGSGKVGIIPFPVIIFIIIIAVAYFLLNHTLVGRRSYIVGGNPKAAQLSGVSVRKGIITAYIISGIGCGISGVLVSALTAHVNYTMTDGYELDVLAAIIVGGASLSGGVGTVLGTVFGAVFIGLINNGLNLLNVPGTLHPVVKGVLIILAVLFNLYSMKVEQNRGKGAEQVKAQSA